MAKQGNLLKVIHKEQPIQKSTNAQFNIINNVQSTITRDNLITLIIKCRTGINHLKSQVFYKDSQVFKRLFLMDL